MKFWKFTSLAALALATTAQPMMAVAEDAPACPYISVTGSQSGVDGAIFTANVSDAAGDVTYNWSISAGSIAEGQGTPTISVGEVGDPGTTVTATVDLGGLPSGCDTSDSDTVEITAPDAQ